MSKTALTSAAGLAALAALMSAQAQAEVPLALDRIDFSIGGYGANSNATARINNVDTGSLGTNVDFERDFGLPDDRAIGRVRFSFLVGDTQGFEVDAYRFRRSGEQALDRSIVYNGNTYAVNANVRGALDMDFASVAWRWWIPAGPNDVWGVGVGGGYYRIRGVVQGDATVNDHTEFAKVEDSADAWVPLLELGWRHAFSDSVRVYADVSGVEKGWGNLTGHIYSADVGAEWYPWTNLGFALEYGAQRILVNSDRKRFDGRLKLDLDGPSAFVKLRF